MLAALLAGALEDAKTRRLDTPLTAVERQASAMPPAIDALAAYHDAQARLERLAAPAPTDAKDAR